MSDERWTAETEELVAQAIGDPGSLLPRGDNYRETIPRWGMRAVLTALADAGLLLSPDVAGPIDTPYTDLQASFRRVVRERDVFASRLKRAERAQSSLDYALRFLVTLKDGPRDAAYKRDKVAAWEIARQALASSRPDRGPAQMTREQAAEFIVTLAQFVKPEVVAARFVDPKCPREYIEDAYRAAARRVHPAGARDDGDTMARLNAARDLLLGGGA